MEASRRFALVTGANGFVGCHLAVHLLRKGYRVRALVRATSDLRSLEGMDLEYAFGDVTSTDSLPGALEGIQIVFHVAGVTKSRDPDRYFQVNEEGSRTLAAAARNAGGVERFVFVSSQAATGPSSRGRPRREEDPPSPTGSYGRSKLAGEDACRQALAGGPALTVVRPSSVYGPWERDFLTLFKMARSGVAFRLLGDHLTSMIHAADLASLLEKAASSPTAAGRTYYAADPSPYWMRTVIRAIGETLGRRVLQIPVPAFVLWPAALVNELFLSAGGGIEALTRTRIQEYRVRNWAVDSSRAVEELAWAPEHSLREGLQDTAQWYRSMGWL